MRLSKNQVLLARIYTDNALGRMRQRVVESPQQRLLQALDEAIGAKRGELNELPAGSEHYLVTLAQIKRWEEVRRVNR